MMSRFIHRMRTLKRFLFPLADERRYARLLQNAPEFDRSYYVHSNPRMHALFQRAPELHYVLFGEALGLSPNPHFSPRAYLFHNPDLAAKGVQPLRHYIERGQAEARKVQLPSDHRGYDGPSLPTLSTADIPENPAPVAVLLHLYYHDMWPEFSRALKAQCFDFDLYVTLTGDAETTAPLQGEIQRAFPQARVWAFPNHGRDIFPFVYLLNVGLFEPYRALCKLHSKKSPHRTDGDHWRQLLMAGVLGDPVQTQARLATFLADPTLGFWVADGEFYQGNEWWGPNRARAETLLARQGISTHTELSFPAGSIYWIKPALMQRIRDLKLNAEDFEPEQALVDGTTAHAMERALGYLTLDEGLRVCEAHQLSSR